MHVRGCVPKGTTADFRCQRPAQKLELGTGFWPLGTPSEGRVPSSGAAQGPPREGTLRSNTYGGPTPAPGYSRRVRALRETRPSRMPQCRDLRLDVAYATSGCKREGKGAVSRGHLQSRVAYATCHCKTRHHEIHGGRNWHLHLQPREGTRPKGGMTSGRQAVGLKPGVISAVR